MLERIQWQSQIPIELRKLKYAWSDFWNRGYLKIQLQESRMQHEVLYRNDERQMGALP